MTIHTDKVSSCGKPTVKVDSNRPHSLFWRSSCISSVPPSKSKRNAWKQATVASFRLVSSSTSPFVQSHRPTFMSHHYRNFIKTSIPPLGPTKSTYSASTGVMRPGLESNHSSPSIPRLFTSGITTSRRGQEKYSQGKQFHAKVSYRDF